MSKPLVEVPDAERLTVDLLESLIASYEPDVTVGIGVPDGWDVNSDPHLEVAWDGTPVDELPAIAHATIRIVARAATSTEAKRLAGLAQGLLLAHNGSAGISVIRNLTGVLPAQDNLTRAELAAVTLRVTVRTTPIS